MLYTLNFNTFLNSKSLCTYADKMADRHLKMEECSLCPVQELFKKKGMNLYWGSARMTSMELGEAVDKDCNVNCSGLNADWDFQSKLK